MDKFLYSDDNVCNLTKQLITLLEIPISKKDERTAQIIKKCHQIVGNTMIEVYNKYGYNMEINKRNVEKLNAKCLDNCLKKMKNINENNELKRSTHENQYPPQNRMSQKNNTNGYRNPNEVIKEMFNPNEKKETNNINSFSFSGGNEYAPISNINDSIQGGMQGMIMSANGKFEQIGNINPTTNSFSKKDNNENYSDKIAMHENDRKQFMPTQTNEQSVNPDIAKWLNLGGNSPQFSANTQGGYGGQGGQQGGYGRQQGGQQAGQQGGQQGGQQAGQTNQFNNNQQFMNNLINQAPSSGIDNYFSPSNDNTGSGLDNAFSGIPILQQATAGGNNQNQAQFGGNNQNQFNNNTDPNERLKKIQAERGDIDNMASTFQNGNNFDPTKSPYEQNKKFLEEESKNSSVFFLKKK